MINLYGKLRKESLCTVVAEGIVMPDGFPEKLSYDLGCDRPNAWLYLWLELREPGTKWHKPIRLHENVLPIPERYRNLAGLEYKEGAKALLVNMRDHLELWRPRRLDRYLAELNKNIEVAPPGGEPF